MIRFLIRRVAEALVILVGAGVGGCSQFAAPDASAPSQPAPVLFEVSTPLLGPPPGGFQISISQGAQFNDDPLHIGCRSVASGGVYDDEETKAERVGPHAGLDIVLSGKVPGKPRLYRQLDVAEGQVIDVDFYRILLEKILPPGTGRGEVIIGVWRRAPGS